MENVYFTDICIEFFWKCEFCGNDNEEYIFETSKDLSCGICGKKKEIKIVIENKGE